MLKTRSGRCIKQNSDYNQQLLKKSQQRNLINQIKKIQSKSEPDRSNEEIEFLNNFKDLVQHVDVCKQNRLNAQAHQEIIIDDEKSLKTKCLELSKALAEAKSCVVYTGAGISTAASIPDYRGPNGLWTMLEKGVKIDLPDFSMVQPTFSHMALIELIKNGLVNHVVSQNCDGLHLRSGIDRSKLSELHGNCFVEFCSECYEEHLRLFDVTEKSSFRKHSTGRYCKLCKDKQLKDSIIHFGEKLRNGMPYNWEGAKESVKNADLIICLGTSLKVLKHYACLWPKKKNVKIYIVNIQWTPKDKIAELKINGYCDEVMKLLIKFLNNNHSYNLNVNSYVKKNDPLFKLAIKLEPNELITTTKSFLEDKVFITDKDEKNIEDKEQLKSENSITSDNSWFTKSFKKRNKTNGQTNFKKEIKNETC